MEMQMKTLTKGILGAALLAGSMLTVSAPANAQPNYGGDGVYGREFNDYGRYGDSRYGNSYDERFYNGGRIWRDTRHCTSPRLGRWRFSPAMQRRVFVPYRWAVRSGAFRDCMYVMNRYGTPGPYRY
jgi:hypothetical protein